MSEEEIIRKWNETEVEDTKGVMVVEYLEHLLQENRKLLKRVEALENNKDAFSSCKYEVKDGEIIVKSSVKVKTHLNFHKLWKKMIMMEFKQDIILWLQCKEGGGFTLLFYFGMKIVLM